MPRLSELKIKLFTDGADKAQIVEMARQPWIAGFTTNPSLLKKAGVDLSQPDTVRAIVTQLDDLVTRLAQELALTTAKTVSSGS